jgi:hypothetical protein
LAPLPVLLLAWAALMLALLAAPAAAAPAAAPVIAKLAVSAGAGFGRVVFTFAERDKVPGYTDQFNNGVLVLRFDEPVRAAVEGVATALPGYVLVTRRDPDGTALRFATQRQVRVNVQAAGEKLFVDFLPPTWRGAPPPVPAEVLADLAERARLAMDRMRAAEDERFGAETMPKLSIAVARRPELTRLAFTWNVPFSADLSRDGDEVRIGFDRAGRADLAAIQANLPDGVKAVALMPGIRGATAVITVAPDRLVRGFREADAFILDLAMPGVLPPELAPPAGAKGAIGLDGATALKVAEPPPAVPGPKLAEAALPLAEAGEPVVETGRDPPPDATPAALPVAPAAPGSIRVERDDDKDSGAGLTVSFGQPVAAAVFQRHDRLFALFDGGEPLDTSGVAAALADLVHDVTVERVGAGQLLRLELARPLIATSTPVGNAWRIQLGDASVGARQALAVTRAGLGSDAARLVVELPRAGRTYTFQDAAIGDRLVVVTADGPARGIVKPYGFVGGALLPTAQGVAVVAEADDLTVRSLADGIEVTRPGGLALSREPAEIDSLDIPGTRVRPKLAVVDGSAFLPPEAGLLAEERTLRAEIIERPPAGRAEARLKLARLYIGLRLAPEALGTLRLASDEQPALARDPAFIILYAAGQVLMGRAGAAREALARGEIADSPDAAFWRTIATVGAGRFDEGRAAARLGETVAETYPADLVALFRLAAAEAEIELGDASRAQAHLARIDTSVLAADLRGAWALLSGRVLDASGRREEALKRYDEASASGDRKAEAAAEYRRVTQQVRDGRMSAEEAIKRLQSLAFSWRGDQTELRTLRALANLQAGAGHWRDAFTSMRAADLVGPNSDEARLLQVDMAREFAGLYLDGKADALDPIEALALYYDFRQLTPPGRLGDAIVRRLADRLVGVDLLDQAAELYAYQIDNRLRGAARAQIAADLAAVHLMNRKPAEALAVLNRTEQSGLSAAVERQRRLMQARALADTGNVDQGLALLSSLDGDDAARLAADIQWRAKRWGEAGHTLAVALAARSVPADAALDAEREHDILKAAVGLVLGGDDAGVARLAAAYGAAMAKSGSANAFALITQSSRSAADVAKVAGDVAAAEPLRGFLDEYRKRYMTPDRPTAKPGDAPPPAAKSGDAAPPPAAKPGDAAPPPAAQAPKPAATKPA